MLVTLADMKAYLNIESSDTAYDDIITDMINAVGAQFDNYTNRTLEADDYTLQIDGSGLDHIFLPDYPINSITSLHIDTDRVFGDDAEISTSNYVKYDASGKITLVSNSWWCGKFPAEAQCVKIVYNAGYITTAGDTYNLPADIYKACKDQVKYLYRKWQNSEEGLSSYSTVNNAVTLVENTALIKLVTQTLDRYVSRYHGCL